jgi:hypothetical protein
MSGIEASCFPVCGSAVGMRPFSPYNGIEGSCSPHPPRGPSFASAHLRAVPLRPEDGTWKVVHRHADPITTVGPAESVIQE